MHRRQERERTEAERLRVAEAQRQMEALERRRQALLEGALMLRGAHGRRESERRLDTCRRGGAQVMSALRGGGDDVQRARALDVFVIITIPGKGKQAASRGEELGSVLCHVRHALQRRKPARSTLAALHRCRFCSAAYRDALAPRRCSRAAS